MKIVAIYIKNHQYLFDKPQTINFGGKYLYEFKESANKITVTRKENELFIEDFFVAPGMPNKLTLVSAIVGQNGAGKTSVMNCIRACFVNTQQAFARNEILILAENESGETVFAYSNFSKVKLKIGSKTIKIEYIGKDQIQTIYYSPHYDYTYNSNFDNIDSHDISFDTIVENDLEDLRNKDTNNNGIPFSASQELMFKNSARQILFLNSAIVQKNKEFKEMFKLPDYEESILIWRSHQKEDAWNTPYNFRPIIEDINKKIEAEIKEWTKVRKFDKKLNVINQHEVHQYISKRYIIRDMLSVMFRKMEESNTNLQEGEFIDSNYLETIKELDAYETFNFFIKNAVIQHKNEAVTAFDFEVIEQLLLSIYSAIDSIKHERKIENNLIYTTSENALNILELHRKFVIDVSYYYLKSIKPEHRKHRDEKMMDGFINYMPTENKLSSGQNALLNLFSRVYDLINNQLNPENPFLDKKPHYVILIDEGDLGFHPIWKKKYLKALVNTLPYFFEIIGKEVTFQIIFSTHDPLSLSDIPNNNVTYIKNNEETGVSDILEDSENLRPKYSFGANITDLLSDSFFIEDGLIGDFAKEKISRTLEWLKIEGNKHKKGFFEVDKSIVLTTQEKNKDYHKKIIELIGEPVIKHQLKSMYMEFIDDNDYIESEIEKLSKLKK